MFRKPFMILSLSFFIVIISVGCIGGNSNGINPPEGTETVSKPADAEKGTEEQIFEIFADPNATAESKKSIFILLGSIDWMQYDKVSGGNAFLLSDWLYSTTIENDQDLVSVLNATNGLDGAIAEGYSGVVAKLYKQQPIIVVKHLGEMKDEKALKLCEYIAYGSGSAGAEEFKKILTDTKELLHNENLTQKEKEVVSQLINAFLVTP